MSVQLYTCLNTCTHHDQNYQYFSVSLTFFGNINQEHNLLPDCMSLDSLLMYWYVKIYVRLLCLCSYYWQYFVQINAKANGKRKLFNNSAPLSLVGGNSLVHKLGVMAAVKLHLIATYTEHLALKSVYEKRQYIMRGKLFSSKIIFELSITCL